MPQPIKRSAAKNYGSTSSGIVCRDVNAPRQSAVTQIRLKTIRNSVDRLTAETEELIKLRDGLQDIRSRLIKEGRHIHRMFDVVTSSVNWSARNEPKHPQEGQDIDDENSDADNAVLAMYESIKSLQQS